MLRRTVNGTAVYIGGNGARRAFASGQDDRQIGVIRPDVGYHRALSYKGDGGR